MSECTKLPASRKPRRSLGLSLSVPSSPAQEDEKARSRSLDISDIPDISICLSGAVEQDWVDTYFTPQDIDTLKGLSGIIFDFDGTIVDNDLSTTFQKLSEFLPSEIADMVDARQVFGNKSGHKYYYNLCMLIEQYNVPIIIASRGIKRVINDFHCKYFDQYMTAKHKHIYPKFLLKRLGERAPVHSNTPEEKASEIQAICNSSEGSFLYFDDDDRQITFAVDMNLSNLRPYQVSEGGFMHQDLLNALRQESEIIRSRANTGCKEPEKS